MWLKSWFISIFQLSSLELCMYYDWEFRGIVSAPVFSGLELSSHRTVCNISEWVENCNNSQMTHHAGRGERTWELNPGALFLAVMPSISQVVWHFRNHFTWSRNQAYWWLTSPDWEMPWDLCKDGPMVRKFSLWGPSGRGFYSRAWASLS